MSTSAPNDRAGTTPFEPDVAAPAPEPGEGEPVETPDITKTGEVLREHVEIRSIAITGLFVLALFYTLYFAREFFLPIVLAVLLDFLLSPLIRAFKRARIPEPLGAAIVILALLGGAGVAVYSLATPAREWVGRLPTSMREAQSRLQALRKPVEQVSKTAEQVEQATQVAEPKATEVIVKGPSLTERLFGTTQSLLTGAIEVIILLYFLLAAGDLFLQKLIKVLPLLRDKKKAVAIARETEASISTYLATITLVNIALGVAVTGVMYLLKMPNPLLWGALAALAEFVPYLGATAMLTLLTLAGLVTFEQVGHALLVPAAYLTVNLLQSQLLSPLILGRRLTLNPVAIFIGLVFWWWIWGVPGAFIAVPLIATFKIFCDHIESLAAIGEFLGR
ncbi:MAG TPA: AI-2E family transporter [Gemmatimonadales bacterium]|nr:AI-2E family transporter [Gemmatimonadales bacterium]